MVNVFKLLILLTLLSFISLEGGIKENKNMISDEISKPKKPVYNPLRQKPYTKNTIKV